MHFLRIKDNFCCVKAGTSHRLDFQNWNVRRLLGKGAFGKVYHITHSYTTQNGFVTKCYALKVLKKSQLVKNGLTSSTFTERDALLDLDHDFILNLHYSFHTTKRVYMVIDLIEGGDLYS